MIKFDTGPMGNPDDIKPKLKDDKFFIKIDLIKIFWQIILEKDCILNSRWLIYVKKGCCSD